MSESTSVVNNEAVYSALRTDKGPEAVLLSWSYDDYVSHIGRTSAIKILRVKYVMKGFEEEQQEVSYILKEHPSRGEAFDVFYGIIYNKECKFYSEVIPALNAVLREIGFTPLNFPRCMYYNLEKGKDIIILENLKEQGYKMEDKTLGISLAHGTLVLKELAKLHAASVLLQAKSPNEDLAERFECLHKEWTKEFNIAGDFGSFMGSYLDIGIAMFEKFGDSPKVVNWIKKIKPNAWKMFDEMLVRSPPFTLILHGDCWIDNLLFRYDESNNPVEVKFLDLQGCRKGSLALDLHQFLDLNLTGPVRRPNLPNLLETYHNALSDVMVAGGAQVPFTLEELRQEYIAKGFYGAIYGIMWLPNMVRRPEDATDILDPSTGAKLTEKENVLLMVDNNPLLKPRIMSVMEEWIECGLIS